MDNNFPTEAEWKEFAKKYKVPEKIGKAHSKKVIELRTLFDKANLNKGGTTSILAANVDAAKAFLEKATKTSYEFTRAIDLEGGLAAEDNKKLKVRWATIMLNVIQNLHDASKKAVDPFAQSRANYPKALNLYAEWAKTPKDPVKLTEMYGQGMRNHLGANINIPPGQMTDEVKKLVGTYQQTVAKWMNTGLNQKNAEALVNDPEKLKTFGEDMKQLMETGKKILDLTKP